MIRLCLILAVAAAAAIALAACQDTIKPEGAAQSVEEVVSSKTGFHPTDVSCPDGVEAKVGGTFDCHFTGPDADYVAHVTIESIDGDTVHFQINSVPVGQ